MEYPPKTTHVIKQPSRLRLTTGAAVNTSELADVFATVEGSCLERHLWNRLDRKYSFQLDKGYFLVLVSITIHKEIVKLRCHIFFP